MKLIIKKKIKIKKAIEEAPKQMWTEVDSKSSLNFLRSVGVTNNQEYLNLERKLRRGIAWFKMGRWIWKEKKIKKGRRKCFLCEGTDDAIHSYFMPHPGNNKVGNRRHAYAL